MVMPLLVPVAVPYRERRDVVLTEGVFVCVKRSLVLRGVVLGLSSRSVKA